VSGDLDDLLPLFLGEAGERLERVAMLADRVEVEPQAAIQARRQLHALKGAANMMRLKEMAALCHAAEELLEPVAEGASHRLLVVLDQLMALVAALEGGTASVGDERSESAGAEGTVLDTAPRVGAEEATTHRVSTAVLDALADRSARLRLLALTAGGITDRAFELVQAAEGGANEDRPDQVLATLATSLRQVAVELDSNQRGLHHLARQQLDQLLRLQVEPLTPFLLSLASHARELADDLDRRVRVRVDAGGARLDRRLVATLKESFVHLVRNAVDHGIEPPEQRRIAGKPEEGRVGLGAATEGDRVRITVVDDGGGIDAERVVATALTRGLITEQEAVRLSPAEAIQLLYVPGFTTRESASQVSGRGVGLDAVATAVRAVGGDVWIESVEGRGTTVTVDVPVARRGERVLVLEVGRCQLALPAAVARGFRAVSSADLEDHAQRQLVRVDGRVVPVYDLGALLGEPAREDRVLIEGLVGGTERALLVDRVVSEEETLIRPLPAAAGSAGIFDGMALLGSGRPVPVIAPGSLVALEGTVTRDRGMVQGGSRPLRLLLVDDSTVTLEMLRRLLEDAGCAVATAASAEHALTALAEQEFECLVTDIEMPGIDGLELTRRLRASAHFAHLPIVVVSTRDRPQDRLAGLEAGADAYLSKQGLDARELVSVIRRVGGGA